MNDNRTQLEEYYKSVECNTTRLIEYRNGLEAWLEEAGMKEFQKKSRTRFLNSVISELRDKIKSDTNMIRELLPTNGDCLVPIVEKLIQKSNWKLERVLMEKRVLDGKVKEGHITPNMIELAKEFPISSLIELDRNKAKCINHNDKHPSMDCRNNFVYCYSCGYSADAIGVYRKIHGVGFVEAVKALTSG